MVKYKNKLHPWKFICVLPVARNPIKISSPNLAQLKPVHEGIRRVLLAQQRGGGRSSGRGASYDRGEERNEGRGEEEYGGHGSQRSHAPPSPERQQYAQQQQGY
jgi:hypothetical protein